MPSPVTAELRLQNSQFLAALNQSISAVKKGADESTTRFGLLGKAASDTFSKMGASSGVAGQGMSLLSKTGGELGTSMGAALPIVGAAAAVVGVLSVAAKSSVSSFLDFASQVRTVEGATGAQAAEAERLVSVSNVLNVSTDSLAKSMGIMSRVIVEQPQKFAEFGVQIARNKDGTADLVGTLGNLSDAYRNATSAAARNDAVRTLLGRGYQELRPLLAQTREQLDAIANAATPNIPQSAIDSARQLQIQTHTLGEEFGNLQRKVGAAITPFLTREVTGIGRAIDFLTGSSSRAASALGELESQTKAAATADQEAAAAESQLQSAMTASVSARSSLASATRALQTLEKQGAVDAKGVADARRGLTAAEHGAADAARGLSDAQRSLNDLLAKGKVDAQQVAAAEKDLERSSRSTENARKSLTDAENQLADVRRGASGLDRQEADLQVKEASTGLAEARQRLIELAQSGTATGLDYQRAQESVTEAQIAQARAIENRNKVMAEGTDGAPDTIAAQQAVDTATRNVADAEDAQRTAADNLRTAQAGDPQFDQTLADARQRVADAAYRVQEGNDAERDAETKLKAAQAGDQDYFTKLADARQAVAQAGFAAATAADNEQKALDAAGPSAAILRGHLEQIARDYPAAAAYIAQIEATIPGSGNGGVGPDGIPNLLRAPGNGGVGADGIPNLLRAPPAGGRGPLRQFASGGWVDAPSGQPVPAIVHGGEFVVSRDMMRQGGSAGTTNIVYLTVNGVLASSVQQFVDGIVPQVRTALQRTQSRTAGSVV